jgi:hypothetical protein
MITVVWLRVLRAARNACVGLGFSALICAVGLALWGWLVAEPSQFEGNWDPLDSAHGYAWRHKFPVGPAVSVVGIAVILIGVSAYRWRRGGRLIDPTVRALAVLAALYFAALSFGLPAFYHVVMRNYPVTTAVPLVVASWVLGLVGALALAGAASVEVFTRKSLAVIAGGVVVGAVTALVLTLQAVGAGDERRYVDATVAPTVDVPAELPTFGQKRFSIKVSDWHGPANQPDVQVAAAGAGFVVFHGGQITGYGSDGKERWHYRRSGPRRVSIDGFRVFDQGRTVVAAVTAGPTDEARLLVGLDAVTGRQLWSARSTMRTPETMSFHPYRNTHGVEARDPSPFLIEDRYDGSRWTRLDTRTGKAMWTVDAPLDHDCSGVIADTESQIATATQCFANKKVTVGFVVLDPASGKQIWQTTLARDLSDKGFMLWATPAGQDGVQVTYKPVAVPTPPIYVNVATHQMRDLGLQDSVVASPERADVYMVRRWRGADSPEFGLYDANGVQRCTLPPGIQIAQDLMADYYLYLPLADQVVVYDRDAKKFNTIDKSTCAVLGAQPGSSAVDWLASAPGAVLVERIERDGTYVDGYGYS